MIGELKNNWEEKDNKLFIRTKQENFTDCVELINKIARIAEEQNHHPNLFIKEYRILEIEIYTHDENKVTEKDWKLAVEIDDLLR